MSSGYGPVNSLGHRINLNDVIHGEISLSKTSIELNRLVAPNVLYKAVVLDYIINSDPVIVKNQILKLSLLYHASTSNKQEYLDLFPLSELADDYSGTMSKDPGEAPEHVVKYFTDLSRDLLAENPPQGSILAAVKLGNGFEGPMICYPLFSHLTLPLKPSEHVWVIFPNSETETKRGYWISKIVGDRRVEDPNLTVHDRAFDINLGNPDEDKNAYTFVNSDRDGVVTVGTEAEKGASNLNFYDDLVAGATSFFSFKGLPVTKFDFRADDIGFEGSYNTLINLTSDRIAGPELTENSKDPARQPDAKDATAVLGALGVKLGKIAGAGSIDMVAGRNDPGLTNVGYAPTKPTKIDDQVIENARGYEEIHKTKADAEEGKQNLDKGGIDLINDLSRILIAMKTDGDKNFSIGVQPPPGGSVLGLQTDAGFMLTPPLVPTPYDMSFSQDYAATSAKPYIVLKSDELRFISRAGGSIRLVQELGPNTGTKTQRMIPGSTAGIVIYPDGLIHLHGRAIYLGDNLGQSANDGTSLTTGNQQGIVKMSAYQQQMQALVTIVKHLIGLLITACNPAPAPNGAVNTCPPFAPHVGLAAIMPQLLLLFQTTGGVPATDLIAGLAKLPAELAKDMALWTGLGAAAGGLGLHGAIPSARSTHIFGE